MLGPCLVDGSARSAGLSDGEGNLCWCGFSGQWSFAWAAWLACSLWIYWRPWRHCRDFYSRMSTATSSPLARSQKANRDGLPAAVIKQTLSESHPAELDRAAHIDSIGQPAGILFNFERMHAVMNDRRSCDMEGHHSCCCMIAAADLYKSVR